MIVITRVAIEKAAETADIETDVPSREVAGDDGCDSERPQHPDTGVSLQSPLLEVALVDVAIGDRADLLFGRHETYLPSDTGGD